MLVERVATYIFSKEMTTFACAADKSCPYQYYCDEANNQCTHDPVFPMGGYPIAVYCLVPFAAALCNTTGNSFGEFKVVLLMIALNYSQADATVLSYPLVAGTALYNFFLLMFRRHPTKNTTLVDYNIVMIIIPSVLFGSTIGTILNDIVPPVVANSMIIVLLAMFSIKFFCKLRTLLQEDEDKDKKDAESMQDINPDAEHKVTMKMDAELPQIKIIPERETKEQVKQEREEVKGEREEAKGEKPEVKGERGEAKGEKPEAKVQTRPDGVPSGQNAGVVKIETEIIQVNNSETKTPVKSNTLKLPPIGVSHPAGSPAGQASPVGHEQIRHEITSDSRLDKGPQENPFKEELDAKIEYEESLHIPHIATILAIFIVFALIALSAQGKIVKFSNCSIEYVIGMVALTVFYGATIIVIKKYINNRMEHYREIGYEYEYPLDTWRYFGVLCAGAFFGGFNAGLFSKGNSTTIIFTLMYLGVEPIVASAIVGFQVVFSAAVSLTQAYSKDQISSQDIGFYLALTFIGGGILSHIASSIVKKMDKNKVNKILVCIIGILTATSSVSLMVSMGISFSMFGKDYMVSAGDFCQV